ncbi:unnamed protein product [Mycena citricolor]|uniref:Uncharacterized protein n=1 Tax=Mycena citricolor TaxID=2018698 RepID=A0AAD2JVX3_9AGAR|nr:unnamed protein product [Mycena citricolor]
MSAASFNPTPAELALTNQIFATADPQKLGVITGEVAVGIFGGANLSPIVLGEIWQIADEGNNGWLSHKGVAVAVRLMGHAQKGEKVSPALLSKPCPLPNITGFTPVVAQGTGASRTRSPIPTAGMPPFTPQDKAKFQNMFVKAGPVDGLLSSDKAQEIFIKSKLPNDVLGQIWNLADTQDRGRLDSTDFAIGMYLIQAKMTGQLPSIPSTLPPGFYQQVAGQPQSTIRTQATGGSFSPLASSFSQTSSRSAVQPQYTGGSMSILQPQSTGPWPAKAAVPPQLPMRTGASAIGGGAFGSTPAQAAWDVTPAEKTTADHWFDSLDVQRRGYIQDDVAVPFLLESKLSGDDLAQIWDLSDLNSDGRLTRDGFAIAWHLIQSKRKGVPIPNSLPPTLIPPHLRNTGSSAFAATPAAAAPPPPEPVKDLFSWDDPVPVPHAAPPTVQPASPQHSAFPASPFNAPSSAPQRDLLDDDEEAVSPAPAVQEQAAEIGNLQNQVNSTSRSLASAQAERQALETTLANQAAQLSALETQLSTAKAAFETENKLLSGLRERHSKQTADMNTVREELIRAESDLSAVRVEKAEIEGAFLRDKEEVRALQKKMVEAGLDIETAKLDVEKAKKEAKQQKGLLAIAKKQLSTKESERAKAAKELQEAQAEAAAVIAEKDHVDRAIAEVEAQPALERATSGDSLAFAASQPLPTSPDLGSPSHASSIKSNNPFDRLMGNTTPRPQSPFALPADSNASTDPFGLNSAFTAEGSETPHAEAFPAETAFPAEAAFPTGTVSTEAGLSPQASEPIPLSPSSEDVSDNDVFLTPVTATGPGFPAIDDVVATASPAAAAEPNGFDHFEPNKEVASDATTVKSHLPDHEEQGETNLNAQLKELDIQESDSDSEDEVPLANIAKRKSVNLDTLPGANDELKPTAVETSFDDVFGSSEPPVSSASGATPFTDAFGMPSVFDGASKSPPVADVSAFDEALGKLPASATSPAQFNAFDSAFDDNFDFGTSTGAAAPAPAPATQSSFPPPPSSNGHAVSPLPASATKTDFGNIFGDSPAVGNGPAAANGSATSAFDEAFSGFDTNPNLKNLSASLDTTAAVPSAAAATDEPLYAPPPSSPPAARSISPPLSHRSPPPPNRASPAKGRSSIGSMKEEKEKEKTRRGLLNSIRLPFGKKKHKDKAEAVPSTSTSAMTPPQEEPPTGVIGEDDDVPSVKQLIGMGFSRPQAVEALEAYDYDVQKALNALLNVAA